MKKPKEPLIRYGLKEASKDWAKSGEREEKAIASARLLDPWTTGPEELKSPAPSKIEPVQIEPAAKSEPLQNLKGSGGGYLRLPHYITDEVLPTLDPSAAIAYIHLYRLSAGFSRETCVISIPALATRCKVSENTVRTAIRQLVARGLVDISAIKNSSGSRGTVFRVPVPISKPLQILKGFKNRTGSKIEGNKENDDFKKKSSSLYDDENPHMQAVKLLYRTLTGNPWTPKDQDAYKTVAGIPIETTQAAMSVAKDRAGSRINSFNFFVKEILSAANPSEASRTQTKKRLTQIVRQIQEAYVGSHPPLSIPDLEEKVMRACQREGVYFDKRLFNEIIERRS